MRATAGCAGAQRRLRIKRARDEVGGEVGRPAWGGGAVLANLGQGGGAVLWRGEAREGERPPKSSSARRGRHGHPPSPRRSAKAIPLPARSRAIRQDVARHGCEHMLP
jgi:hypothetical protein